jgi:macrolide transport system ATP-binding/permease protein
MIQISNLSKVYKMGEEEVRALDGVTLSIGPGEFVAITGLSGSGKSTLLHILGLLDTPDSGSYRLMGREVANLSADDLASIRSKTIGFVFQQFNLLPRTTALENASLPQLYASDVSDMERPRQLLSEVGLENRVMHRPNELSGGQQQRVAIARALVNRPVMLLADEPTGNLDTKSSLEILNLLQKLNREGITVILVTHEPTIAQHAGRIVHIQDGHIYSDERLKPLLPVGPTGPAAEPTDISEHTSGWNTAKYYKYFLQALRSLKANKLRTVLSMLGVLIGVMIVIAMLAMGAGAKISLQKDIANLGANVIQVQPGTRTIRGVSLGWWDPLTRLTLADEQEVGRSISHVKSTAPESWGKVQVAYGNKNWNTYLIGTTPAYAPMKNSVPTAGSFFADEDVKTRNKVAVLGMTNVRQLFGKENPIGAVIKINKINFQVIGVQPEKGANAWWDSDDNILVPITTAMYRVLGQQFIGHIDVEVDSGENIPAVKEAAKDLMFQRHRIPPSQDKAFRINDMADYQNAMAQGTKTLSILIMGIALGCLLVGGIGIMNIMLVTVTERTREIGLRKALGAKRRDILFQFLIESVVISLTGGVIGIVLGWSAAVIFSRIANWEAPVTLAAVLLGFVFSVGVGIAAGFWPAFKASRLNPIDALRYE